MPLKNLKILDIGCGGGLLSEPMCRLGAKVTGIDASEKNINVAKLHSKKNNLKINYFCSSPEKFESKENEILYHFSKKKLNDKHYDFFVFGHRHLPLKIELGNYSYYFNTGDWINHYSFLHFKDDSLELKYFKN